MSKACLLLQLFDGQQQLVKVHQIPTGPSPALVSCLHHNWGLERADSELAAQPGNNEKPVYVALSDLINESHHLVTSGRHQLPQRGSHQAVCTVAHKICL